MSESTPIDHLLLDIRFLRGADCLRCCSSYQGPAAAVNGPATAMAPPPPRPRRRRRLPVPFPCSAREFSLPGADPDPSPAIRVRHGLGFPPLGLTRTRARRPGCLVRPRRPARERPWAPPGCRGRPADGPNGQMPDSDGAGGLLRQYRRARGPGPGDSKPGLRKHARARACSPTPLPPPPQGFPGLCAARASARAAPDRCPRDIYAAHVPQFMGERLYQAMLWFSRYGSA